MLERSSLLRQLVPAAARALAGILVALGTAAGAQDRLVVDPGGKSIGGLDYGLQFGPLHSTLATLPCVRAPIGVPGFAATVAAGVASGVVTANPLLHASAVGISSNQRCFENQFGLDFYTSGQPRVSIDASGRAGFGTIEPERAVDVRGVGDVEVAISSADPNGRTWTLQSTGTPQPGAPVAGTFQIIDRSPKVNAKRLWIDPDGTVNVGVLRINGGADIAEPFAGLAALPRGSVVVIDDKAPGNLTLSDRAYDHRVAGIISGANGIGTGLALQPSEGAGGQNVALTGRVYALADASGGRIRVGDLLTTSATPGHVMKARDTKRARGAIVGKAMTPLDGGAGYVLVLVSLQ